MDRLRRFVLLPSVERRLFARAVLLLALLRAVLWKYPARAVRDRLAARGTRPVPGPTPAQIGWAVRSAARYVPGATCLAQAVAASILLSRAGRPAVLQIGVTKPNRSTLSAHAWVESDGLVVVGDAEHDRYHHLSAI